MSISVEQSSFEAAIAAIFIEAMRAGVVTGRNQNPAIADPAVQVTR